MKNAYNFKTHEQTYMIKKMDWICANFRKGSVAISEGAAKTSMVFSSLITLVIFKAKFSNVSPPAEPLAEFETSAGSLSTSFPILVSGLLAFKLTRPILFWTLSTKDFLSVCNKKRYVFREMKKERVLRGYNYFERLRDCRHVMNYIVLWSYLYLPKFQIWCSLNSSRS